MKVDLEMELERKKNYYVNEFKQGFYNELRDKILPLIEQAVPIKEIKKHFNLTTGQIAFLVMHKNVKQYDIKLLGCKTESYYTENEMMKTISYSYDDLSPDEKLIYNEI